MKKRLLFLATATMALGVTGCVTADSESSESNTSAADTAAADTSELNYADIAKYAAYINDLFAADDNLTGFWWDCSDIVFRKSLTCQQDVVDGIMGSYKNHPAYAKATNGYAEEGAHTAVKNMKAGWNLGNTLDSNSYKALWNATSGTWYDNWASTDENEKGWMVKWNDGIITWETGWGQPKTTQEIIALVKSLGFDAVRMPVTWAEHIDAEGNIDAEWMTRVKECVDYVMQNDMYCIVNLHHDGGSDGWIKACESSWSQYQGRFEKIWTQVAKAFAAYDERLLFESMNEVLDENATWNPGAQVATDANVYINKWNQLFVTTVRNTGENNATRNLIIMTYAGDGGATVFENGFELPQDSVENHLIIEVHNYNPQAFTSKDATWTTMTAIWNEQKFGANLTADMQLLSEKSREYGAPIIVGEYAAFPKKYAEYDK